MSVWGGEIVPAAVICRQAILRWLGQPIMVVSAVLLALSYTFLVEFGAQATTNEPVAVVNLDRGPIGAHLTDAIVDSGVFTVYVTTAARAREMYGSKQLKVAAVMTIPRDLTARVRHHHHVQILVRSDNVDDDLALDVRRAGPTAIYYYYRHLGRGSPLRLTMADHLVHGRSVSLIQYAVLPIIILIATVYGVISTGMAVATEFQNRTIKELYFAPISRGTIIAGKMAAGFISTFTLAAGMLVFGALKGWTRPEGGRYWLAALAAIGLASLFSAGLGLANGTLLQRKQPVSLAATILAVDLFALAGGIGVIFFEPEWLQRIAAFDPLTYSIHSLQLSVFYSSTYGFALDMIVLAAAAVITAIAGSLAMRRELVAQ